MDRARAQRTLLGEKFTELTGALVSRVDVRITGVVDAPKESHDLEEQRKSANGN